MPTSDTQASDIQTVAFVSLGCPKNLVDSEKMLGLLAEDGVIPVPADEVDSGGAVDAVVIDAREVLLATAGGFGGSSIEGLVQRAAATRQVEDLVGAQRAGEVVAALTSDPLRVGVLSGQPGDESGAWIAYGGLGPT